jgi:hypothetical protein
VTTLVDSTSSPLNVNVGVVGPQGPPGPPGPVGPTGPAGVTYGPKPLSAEWLGPQGMAFGTQASANGTLLVYSWYLPFDLTFNAIGVEITIPGSAGSLIRLGVYNDNGALSGPGSLLVDAGTLDGTQAAGIRSSPLANLALMAGQYWLAFVQQGAPTTTATVRTSTATDRLTAIAQTVYNTFVANAQGFFAVGVTAALPNPFPPGNVTINAGTGAIPLVKLKLV